MVALLLHLAVSSSWWNGTGDTLWLSWLSNTAAYLEGKRQDVGSSVEGRIGLALSPHAEIPVLSSSPSWKAAVTHKIGKLGHPSPTTTDNSELPGSELQQ